MKKLRLVILFIASIYCAKANTLSSFVERSDDSSIYKFDFIDTKGNIVKLDQFKGKFVFVDFWYTGCGHCLSYYYNILKPLKEHFRNNTDIVFVSISADNDNEKWKNSIKEGQYTSESVINLRLKGGFEDESVKYYDVKGYPCPMFFDRNGAIISRSKKDLRTNGIEKVTKYVTEIIETK